MGQGRRRTRLRYAEPSVAEDARQMSYVDYLALERAAEAKHEYVNGLVYAVGGGTVERSRLASRVGGQLLRLLEGRRCEVFQADLRVRIESTARSTYPDIYRRPLDEA